MSPLGFVIQNRYSGHTVDLHTCLMPIIFESPRVKLEELSVPELLLVEIAVFVRVLGPLGRGGVVQFMVLNLV